MSERRWFKHLYLEIFSQAKKSFCLKNHVFYAGFSSAYEPWWMGAYPVRCRFPLVTRIFFRIMRSTGRRNISKRKELTFFREIFGCGAIRHPLFSSLLQKYCTDFLFFLFNTSLTKTNIYPEGVAMFSLYNIPPQ